jgi:hypothetical protein
MDRPVNESDPLTSTEMIPSRVIVASPKNQRGVPTIGKYVSTYLSWADEGMPNNEKVKTL